jgi:hypothetical protein
VIGIIAVILTVKVGGKVIKLFQRIMGFEADHARRYV